MDIIRLRTNIGKVSLLIFLILILVLPMISFTVQSALFITNQNSNLNSNLNGDEINSNIYITGENVLINTTARGDITGLCQSFKSVKTVFGDITLACSFISINAPVNGDIRIAGQKVSINSDINGEALIFANEVFIKGDIHRDLNLFATEAIINGTVKGPAHIEADEVTINGIFESDLTIDANLIRLGPDALIRGNFNYSSNANSGDVNSLQLNTKVKGKIIKEQEPSEFSFVPGTWLWDFIFSYLIFLTIGFILITLAKEPLQKGIEVLEEKYFWSLIVGLLSFIVIPVMIIFFTVTIIGIPIAIILLALFVIVLFAARIYFIMMIGQKLFPTNNVFIQFALALLFFALISSIPGIGWIFLAIATTLGIGVIFFLITGKKKKRRIKKY